MHVRRLVVSHYGPLVPFDESFAPFTVLRGPNERGKTLLVDSLLRLLFKDELKRGQYKWFGNLTRVSETPEGFVVVATHAEERKLGAGDTLSSISPVPITPEDFRNVFLIRDSDLNLENEADYFGRVSARLCGTRSHHIEKILAALKVRGRLRSATPESVLATRKGERIAEKLEAAEKLIDEMNNLRAVLEGQDFDAADRRLVEWGERRSEIESARERLRAAEHRTRFARARTLVAEVRSLIEKSQPLASLSDEELERWRRALAERDVITRDLSRLEEQRASAASALEYARATVETVRTGAEELDRAAASTLAELKPLAESWRRDQALREHADRARHALMGAMFAAIGLGVAAAVAFFLTRAIFLFGAVVVCALAAGGIGFGWWRARRARAGLEQRVIDIVSRAARLGVGADSVPGVEEALSELESRVRRESERVREAEAELRARQNDLAARESEIAERRERQRALEAAEAALRAETGHASIEPLEAALAGKRRLQSDLEAKLSVLRTWVPAVAGIGERDAMLEACEREVDRHLSAAPDRGVEDDPEEAARLDREIATLTASEQEARRALERGRHDLKRIEFKLAELAILEGPVRCRTTRELSELKQRVFDYCESVQRDRRVAGEAIRIFQEIDLEEREKVGSLFGEGSMVSKWFHEISGGRYRAVHFDAGDEEIEVELANGRRIPASALSGGAFDQLYLSIRASIGSRMLGEAKGFFVLDDPFIKADRERLVVLMRMLRRLVESGWQVIYFTAKDEVVDALQGEIDRGRVHLIELEPSLFFPPPPPRGEDSLRLL